MRVDLLELFRYYFGRFAVHYPILRERKGVLRTSSLPTVVVADGGDIQIWRPRGLHCIRGCNLSSCLDTGSPAKATSYGSKDTR